MDILSKTPTQILLNADATNTTTIIYTVPANKKLYLAEASLHAVANIAGTLWVLIRDTGDTTIRYLCFARMIVGAAFVRDHFEPRDYVAIPAGYDIVVGSDTASLLARGGIFGQLVDV